MYDGESTILISYWIFKHMDIILCLRLEEGVEFDWRKASKKS